MPIKQPAVYIMSNKAKGTLYVGVTGDLLFRIHQHREAEIKGFTKRYGLKRLVYFEIFSGMAEAISREKQLKNWHRQWKLNLIETLNPTWRDLWDEICIG